MYSSAKPIFDDVITFSRPRYSRLINRVVPLQTVLLRPRLGTKAMMRIWQKCAPTCKCRGCDTEQTTVLLTKLSQGRADADSASAVTWHYQCMACSQRYGMVRSMPYPTTRGIIDHAVDYDIDRFLKNIQAYEDRLTPPV